MRSVKFVLFFFFIEAQDLHISYPFFALKAVLFVFIVLGGVELNGHKCLQNAKMV